MNRLYTDSYVFIGKGGTIPNDECKARLRRFEAFESVSDDLVEVILDPASVVEVFKNDWSYDLEYYSDNLDKHREIWDMLRCPDHMSCWLYKNIPMVLVEPYVSDESLQEYLDTQGLAAYLVPINISPYCGNWGPNKGSLPHTRSILYTKATHKRYLEELASLIESAAELQPDWNWLEGGKW